MELGRFLAAEKDEFQRNVLIQCLLGGIGGTLTTTTIWGYLEDFAHAPHLDPISGSSNLLAVRCGLVSGSQTEVQMKNRLKVLRAERDWSQADLAQRLEVSRQSVNAIETGKFDPSLPLAFKLARLFGMRIEEIFTDSDQ